MDQGALGVSLPNNPDAANPAIAPWFQIGDLWREVADPGRYARKSNPDSSSNHETYCTIRAHYSKQYSVSEWTRL